MLWELMADSSVGGQAKTLTPQPTSTVVDTPLLPAHYDDAIYADGHARNSVRWDVLVDPALEEILQDLEIVLMGCGDLGIPGGHPGCSREGVLREEDAERCLGRDGRRDAVLVSPTCRPHRIPARRSGCYLPGYERLRGLTDWPISP